MCKKRWICIISLIVFQLSIDVNAGWQDWLNKLKGNDSSNSKNQKPAGTSLSSTDVVAGLKEALYKSSDYAVSFLGKDGGFMENVRVKIPMPESLRGIEKTLRRVGADKYADEFVASMNLAAERAVKVSAPILSRAIKDMSFEDGMKILRGRDDAATQYFREKTSADLTSKMLPITHEATERSGVTSNYKKMVSKISFISRWTGKDVVDLDA